MRFPIFAQNVTIRVPFVIPVMRRRRNPLKPLILVVHLRFCKITFPIICSKRYYTCSVCESGDASSSELSQTATTSSTFAISQKCSFQY